MLELFVVLFTNKAVQAPFPEMVSVSELTDSKNKKGKSKNSIGASTVAHIHNSSYLGGGNWGDHSLRSVWEKN
jgi:hypothetical protein